jgi:hypothetical protein
MLFAMTRRGPVSLLVPINSIGATRERGLAGLHCQRFALADAATCVRNGTIVTLLVISCQFASVAMAVAIPRFLAYLS